jgi:DNA-binding HxlR family transcriptional regulator
MMGVMEMSKSKQSIGSIPNFLPPQNEGSAGAIERCMPLTSVESNTPGTLVRDLPNEHCEDAGAGGDSGYCPYFQHVVELLGRRWTSSIVMHLTKGPARFSDIAGAIPKLSDRLLTERLHELESERLVERTWKDTCTYYQFSELGRELLPSIEALKAFSHKAAPTIVFAERPGRRIAP